MTLYSGFYDSVSGDRTYNADDMTNVLNGLVTPGVYKGVLNEFAFALGTTFRNVTVGTGRAFFNNRWVYNDGAVTLTLDAPNTSLPRIDSVFLVVDRTTGVRSATFKIVTGTPASTPVRPTITNTTTMQAFRIADVPISANQTSWGSTAATRYIGTPDFPYASYGLIDPQYDTTIMRANTYRGKNLGSSFTSAQKAAIANGTFSEFYIGDYWTDSSGRVWRIVDMNYWKGVSPGINQSTPNHLVIMPDIPLYRARMNSNTSTQGYRNSELYNSGLATAQSYADSFFGSTYISTAYTSLANAVSDGGVHSSSNMAVKALIPNELQIYGTFIRNVMAGRNSYTQGTPSDTRQFSAFRLNYLLKISADGSVYWLRDMESWSNFSVVGQSGEAVSMPANTTNIGVRPCFAIKGTAS